MKSIPWKFLKKGDIVDVISPGYPSPENEILGGADFLRKWDLVPRVPPKLIQKHFLHSNSDERRFAFLKDALYSDSTAIWCTRGGYGSNRLLPELKKLKPPRESKILIGLSDVTSLHCFLTQEWGWSTLHACILDRLGRGDLPKPLERELKRVLFGEQSEITFSKLKPLNDSARKLRKLESSVVGGNLTVLQSSMGTPFQLQTKNKLLFIEDIGERGYRIDRMLEQFRQAGLFKSCEGILLGHFIGGEEPATKKNNFKKVFQRWAGDLDIPIFGGVEAGHDVKQRTLPLNTEATLLSQGGQYNLIVQSGARF